MTQDITLTFTLTVQLPDGAVVTGITPDVVAAPATPLTVVRPIAPPARGPRRRTPRRGELQRSLLTALADAGGVITDGNGMAGSRLAAAVGVATNNCAACTKTLEGADLLHRVMPNSKRCSRISLTPAGWAAIDRTPPRPKDAPTSAAAEPVRAVPPMPEPGPIERRPFDPDQVRTAGADGL